MQRTTKLLLFILSLITMYSCQNQGKDSEISTIIPTCEVTSRSDSPDQVIEFLNRGKVVQLETNDSSLIGGRSGKYLKRDSLFYVQSINDIIVFDSVGNYKRKLSKVGTGKDEYGKILDFDIINRNNGTEIWVASQKEIKRYDAETFEYLGKTKTNDYLKKFRYVNDTTIVTVTPGEQTLRIIDIKGNVRKTYLDKDVANFASKAIQFRLKGDRVIYQISDTDEAVIYNPENDSFTTVEIIPNSDNMLSTVVNREYYEKYGYMNQAEKIAENFTTISSFQIYGPEYLLTTFHPDGSRRITVGNDKESSSLTFSDDVIRLRDGVCVNSPRFLLTSIACDSNRGMLFMIPSEDIEGNDPEANPSLLDIEL